jgi:hypothetical protein
MAGFAGYDSPSASTRSGGRCVGRPHREQSDEGLFFWGGSCNDPLRSPFTEET